MLRCLLVEPDYKTKYPNLALMKLSTKLKQEGKTVEYFKGRKTGTLDGGYDEIYITTLFTYESKTVIATIKHYQTTFPNAIIQVGGIFASLMPDYIERETGITPFTGYSTDLDTLKPDYDLIKTGTKWDDYSYVFTARGCVNHCPYCAVPTLEPEYWKNPDWKNTVDFRRLKIIVLDNNLTAGPMEHFKDVMYFLRKHKLEVTFDSGFDCRLFNENHVHALKGVRINQRGLRFAFDHMLQEGYIQKTINLCLDNDLHERLIQVYVLFNFGDSPEEAEYRMREIVKTGVIPYPQRYVSLTQLGRKDKFVGKHWTEELAHSFRMFYQPQRSTTYRKHTFPEWLEITEKEEELAQFYKFSFIPPRKS